jgi:hypothetical protein
VVVVLVLVVARDPLARSRREVLQHPPPPGSLSLFLYV